jgi:starch synthase (maltosyl-transferring)
VAGIRVAERHNRWHLAVDRWTSGMVERYVCVSQSVADFSHSHGGLPRDKLVVIPNGVNVQHFDQAAPIDLTQLGVPAGRRAITYVGRLDRQKRVDWLLHAASRFLPNLPEHDLLLVGRGPERERLETVAKELGLAERVHFAGWQAQVPAILKASELLVLPSAWEGMPNVVLEAMACGLPVVATDVEGVREVIGPQAQSQVVSAHDQPAFAERVRSLAGDARLGRELGSANHRRAAMEFTTRSSIKAYERLYESLLTR